ncbi:MAG: ribonuclease P protein component [Gammaproteobacteria bacterium]
MGRSGRLTRPQEFKRVFDHGRKVHGRFFAVFVNPNERDESRLGLAISRRSAGNAVRRNLIKRQARHSFRMSSGAGSQRVDVVLIAKAIGQTASRADLYQDLVMLWNRVQPC